MNLPRLTHDEAVERARRLAASGGRVILGIAGQPGAGKSTLAGLLADRLGAAAAAVAGMDGFHLANSILEELARSQRKGCPDTYDIAGYLALLRRLRSRSDDVVYAPLFRRDVDEPLNAAVPIFRHIPLVITEGNYLLMRDPPWDQAHTLIDEIWFVDADDETRWRRLAERYQRHGMSIDEARARAMNTDEVNATLVAATRQHADLIVTSSDAEALANANGLSANERAPR